MTRTEREQWERIERDADDNVRFFSEADREKRERIVVREFLKYLGVEFKAEELIVPEQDSDVDVAFRDARFQNAERMDSDRQRHREYKETARRVRTRDVTALERPWRDNRPITVGQVLADVVAALEKKTLKTARRGSLDALVYINPTYPAYPVVGRITDASAVARLGWRSVSALLAQYAVVICAEPHAPEFIRSRAGSVIGPYPRPALED
jgi:Putative endonuclease, protein of unknown function (DUF1780)